MSNTFIVAKALLLVIPVVFPESDDPRNSGCIRHVPVAVHITNGILMHTSEGWLVRPEKAKQGYVLLADLYAQEENPEGWAMYASYLADVEAGKTRSEFPRRFLPAEVRRRQAHHGEPVRRDKWAEMAAQADGPSDDAGPVDGTAPSTARPRRRERTDVAAKFAAQRAAQTKAAPTEPEQPAPASEVGA